MTQHSKIGSTPVTSPQSLRDEAFIPGQELWLMFDNGSLLSDRWPELENMGWNGREEPLSEEPSVQATKVFPWGKYLIQSEWCFPAQAGCHFPAENKV